MKMVQASACVLLLAQAVWALPGYEAAYEAQTAVKKQADLYKACVETQGSTGKWASVWDLLWGIFPTDLSATFDHHYDTLKSDKPKVIHSKGQVAMARYEAVGDHPFTGVFQSAAHPLIIRLSYPKEPTETAIPAIGVKFLLDGVPSENFVAMYKFDGQKSGNFFGQTLSNHVPNPQDTLRNKVLQWRFNQVENPGTSVALSSLSAAKLDGSRLAPGSEVFPFKLDLVPNAQLAGSAPFAGAAVDADITAMLATIAPETTLYDVVAFAAPNCEGQVIGRIVLTSPLVQTKFGDETLFFRHQRINEDFAVHPDWKTPESAAACPALRK